MGASMATACRRRLADGPAQRWLWALGSSLPLVGLVVLVWHGASRRTWVPFLYGLVALAAVGFVLLTLGGLLKLVTPALVAGVAVVAFAWGHRQGQERAAVDGAKWLDLDR